MKRIKFLFIFLVCFTNCNIITEKENSETKPLKGDLIIFHAGSLAVPLKEITDSFKTKYPKIEIFCEAAGSVECARKITELNKPCDIFFSADYKVIDKLLIPNFAGWNIPFATNEMVIAFRLESQGATVIDSTNWYKILLSKDVSFGRSDPDTDPCGYRTLLCLQIAENYYHKKGIYQKFTNKDKNYIRPKEVDLLAILESKNIDYIFIYRSVAIQHGLKYISLPNQINLGNNFYKHEYTLSKVEIKGKKPGEKILQTGEPMIYSFTIPNNSPNRNIAEIFAKYFLEKGLVIMEKHGQPKIIKPKIENFNKLPEILKPYILNEK